MIYWFKVVVLICMCNVSFLDFTLMQVFISHLKGKETTNTREPFSLIMIYIGRSVFLLMSYKIFLISFITWSKFHKMFNEAYPSHDLNSIKCLIKHTHPILAEIMNMRDSSHMVACRWDMLLPYPGYMTLHPKNLTIQSLAHVCNTTNHL